MLYQEAEISKGYVPVSPTERGVASLSVKSSEEGMAFLLVGSHKAVWPLCCSVSEIEVRSLEHAFSPSKESTAWVPFSLSD